MTAVRKFLLAGAAACALALAVLACGVLGAWRWANTPAASTTLILSSRGGQPADVFISGRPVGQTPVELDLGQLRALLASGPGVKGWPPGKGMDITKHFPPVPGAPQDFPRLQIWDEAVVPEAHEGYENTLHVSVRTGTETTIGVLRVRMTDSAGSVGVRWGAHRFYGWVQKRFAQRIQVDFELRAPIKGTGKLGQPELPPGLE